MWDAMIQFLLVRIRFRIRFANAFGDDFRVALLMAGIFTILALHASRVLQKVSAKSTTHNIIELLQNELVAIQLVNFFFTLTYGAFTVQADIEGPPVCYLFCYSALVYYVAKVRKVAFY